MSIIYSNYIRFTINSVAKYFIPLSGPEIALSETGQACKSLIKTVAKSLAKIKIDVIILPYVNKEKKDSSNRGS